MISMAAGYKPSAKVQSQFAGLMRDLCVSDEIATEIMGAGGIEALVDAAHRHFDDPEVRWDVRVGLGLGEWFGRGEWLG